MKKMPTLTITEDNTDLLKDSLSFLQDKQVLVGVPEQEGEREAGDSINNAALLAINEFGSPANNIPARMPLRTGIRNAQDRIAEEFKKAAQKTLSQGRQALETYFERAGIIASQAVKKAINDQDGMAPPAEATLAARKRRGFLGEKALIVTGQLRNAITYVVRAK